MSSSAFKFANPTFTADNFVTYSAAQIDADASVPTSDELQVLEPIPKPRVSPPILSLADVLSPATVNAIASTGQLVIHCVGDTGGIERAEPQLAVADALTADVRGKTGTSGQPAFFYHLGDVVYFFGQESYYPEQFYEPYRNYPGPIFAIPGNHDGFMFKGEPAGYSCEAFVDNFCTASPTQGAPGFDRTTMTQPGVYFTLDAPFVRIIGLYSNAGETVGSLGNSTIGTAQLTFLTSELKRFASDRKADTKNANPQALVIAVHHPPFTGSSQHMPSAAMLESHGHMLHTGRRLARHGALRPCPSLRALYPHHEKRRPPDPLRRCRQWRLLRSLRIEEEPARAETGRRPAERIRWGREHHYPRQL